MKRFLFTVSILAITTLRRWCVLVDCSLSLAASLYARSAASWAMPDDPQKITFTEMRNMGVRRGMVLCLLLSACSSDKIDVPPVVYVPPSPPTQDAVITGLKAAASEAKLTAPWGGAPHRSRSGALFRLFEGNDAALADSQGGSR